MVKQHSKRRMAGVVSVLMVLVGVSAGTVADLPAVHLPITSRAQLRVYLRDTPLDKSPLRFLPPGARKRFLAELQFSSHGLASTPLDDAEHELTHPQMVQLFGLFGVAYVARGLGLTPTEAALQRRARDAAAKARGCVDVASCPPSEIERHYIRFMLHQPKTSLPEAQRAKTIVQQYDHLFGAYQTTTRLEHMSGPDVRLLKRAAATAVFWAPEARYLSALRHDLDVMQQRGMVSDGGYVALYRGLIAARRFGPAQKLAHEHPHMQVPVLPTWHASSHLVAGRPTALAIAPGGHTMTRRSFNLSVPLRIVIVASCHFSQDAARAVKTDPMLHSLFARHAVWLADQTDSIAAAEAWDNEFPEQPIYIAWRDGEWSMLDSWAMPSFYVFRHGKLVDQWEGWSADDGMQTLLQHLRRDRVLPNRSER